MAKCKLGGEFDNPAVSCWATTLTGQAVVALLLFLVAENPHLPTEAVEGAAISHVAHKTFAALGLAHIIFCVVCSIMCMLGFFLSVCFQIPLLICGVLLQVLCFVTAGIVGPMLTGVNSFKSTTLDDVRAQRVFDTPDFSQIFVSDNEGMLLVVCVLCIVMPIFLLQAKSLTASSPAYEATLYPGAIIVALASSGFFMFCRASGVLTGLSTAWLVVGAVVGISILIQKNCCSRVFSIALSVIFAVGAVFALISGVMVGIRYSEGKKVSTMLQGFNPNALLINTLEDGDYESLKTYELAGDGVFLVVSFCLNISAMIYFVYSALSAFRSLCGPNRNAAVKDEEEGEQAQEA
ncbi:conserved hypothetical protein [Neospora caninum Liverpool]|uniref:Transmembrane protein n=1 Tax=Neospora caninum (strain Liverpool) TaxID=572307 RepID=F0VDG7_NEOCL|nr:conserved hypothetical protein [Neospora caninum Liverpool]CBZ51760.1 conserved hypothetical protein [Neospora caninum Liverpool]CEL65716.1 TPA: hypothetical protein BN1204_015520 [Neospora caninum Liverpool]|eukprot:XP_003881793.1 conserved hypothetical protein [Neospora caninum Liverpool]